MSQIRGKITSPDLGGGRTRLRVTAILTRNTEILAILEPHPQDHDTPLSFPIPDTIHDSPDDPVAVSFVVYHGNRRLPCTTTIDRLDPAGHDVDILVDLPDETFTVRGAVAYPDGWPAAGVIVGAVDQDLNGGECLGETVTDRRGRFEIGYTRHQLRRAEKGTADLIVYARDDTHELVRSELIVNANPTQTVALTIDPLRGLSAFARQHLDVCRLLDGLRLADLAAAHLDFLHRETGLPADVLTALQRDAAWSEAHDVPPGVFYGLIRQGHPPELAALVRSSGIRASLEAALAADQIPQCLAADLDGIVAGLGDLDLALDLAPDTPSSALGTAIVHAPGLDAAAQRTVLRLALDDPDDPWPAIEAALGAAPTQAARFAVQAATLVGAHAPTLAALARSVQEPDVATLASWDDARWSALAHEATGDGQDLPEGHDTVASYTGSILAALDDKLPSQRLLAAVDRAADDETPSATYRHLELDDLDVGTATQRVAAYRSFLQDNPAFDLRFADLDQQQTYVAGEAVPLAWGSVADDHRAPILAQLGAAQRALTLAPSPTTGARLVAVGLDHPAKIVVHDADRLAKRTGIDIDEARRIHANATDQTLAGTLDRYHGTGHVPTYVDNLPDDGVEVGFGVGHCRCDHCTSVLSPAAYFVDLMNFVQREVSGEAHDDLRARRPDLWHLPLSCDRTHGQIPYLEVLDHVLEQHMIDRLGLADVDALYLALGQAWSTFQQPHHPARDEIALHLSHFQRTLADLQRTLGRDRRTVGQARLGISPAEAAIIAPAPTGRATVAQLVTLYGLDAGGVDMPAFLRRAGLTREQAGVLLAGPPSLPDLGLTIEKTEVPGSLGMQWTEGVRDADGGLAGLDRLHRWVRLWRKTGWDLEDFDAVLAALHTIGLAAGTDEAALARLGDLLLLQDRLDLSTPHLPALFGALPALISDDWFEATAWAPLDLDDLTSEAGQPTLQRLSRGLALSESEIHDLLTVLRPALSGPTSAIVVLDARTLGLVTRHVTVARSLDLSVAALLRRLDLTPGVDHLASLDDLFALLDTVDRVDRVPFDGTALMGLGTEAQGLGEELRLLLPSLGADEARAALGQALGRDAASVGHLLTLSNAAARPTIPFDDLEAWATVADRLDLDAADLAFVVEAPDTFGATPHPSIDAIDRLTRYRAWTPRDEADASGLRQILRDLAAGTADDAALAEGLGAPIDTIRALRGAMGLPANPVDVYSALSDAAEACAWLGIQGATLIQIADATPAGRDAILSALQAKYPDPVERAEAATPYLGRVLAMRRDALVDFLTSPAFAAAASGDVSLDTDLDLYAHFLMDPQVEDCAITSWVLAGIASLQVYVHRCSMGLEPRVDASEIPRIQWSWRKNYRVWEANRKVFLFPEAYLDPSARDGRTPFFDELADELLQGELSDAAVDLAYRRYVKKFVAVSNVPIVGAHLEPSGRMHLVGRLAAETPQTFIRTLQRSGPQATPDISWGPWRETGLAVGADTVAPIVHQGSVHLFWLDTTTRAERDFDDGSSVVAGFTHSFRVSHSHEDVDGTWSSPHTSDLSEVQDPMVGGAWIFDSSIEGADLEDAAVVLDFFGSQPTSPALSVDPIGWGTADTYRLQGWEWDRVFPIVELGQLGFVHGALVEEGTSADREDPEGVGAAALGHGLRRAYAVDPLRGVIEHPIGNVPGAAVLTSMMGADYHRWLSRFGSVDAAQPVVGSPALSAPEFVLSDGVGSFLTTRETHAIRLGSPAALDLAAILFTQDLPTFLSLDTQERIREPEPSWWAASGVSMSPIPDHLDFGGPCGLYYAELYLHIPWLVASQLNAGGRYAEAQRWYHHIFDPTASDPAGTADPADRFWRYLPFRGQTAASLHEQLTDPGALARYHDDPFSPWPIAQLRRGALQRAVVMAYIDNLLDWGDALFLQDTYESINEATLLYLTALDILGPRPPELGACPVPEETTYDAIERAQPSDEEVLVNLVVTSGALAPTVAAHQTATKVTASLVIDKSGTFEARTRKVGTPPQRVAARAWADPEEASPVSDFVLELERGRVAFCIPPNAPLLAYWDRVDDRLFKIRNCLSIEGVRRALALFQPPLDPALLVRAKAAGIALDGSGGIAAPRPGVRFAVLVERARSLIGTVQGFGNALQGALEKKDAEELQLLRATQERNLLRLTRQIRDRQILEAQHQVASLEASLANAEGRVQHYGDLLATGMNSWEVMEQSHRQVAASMRIAGGTLSLAASLAALIPQIGSPFAMKFGGEEVSRSFGFFAETMTLKASMASEFANTMGVVGSQQRRAEEWRFQLQTAERDLDQIRQHLEAARIRQEIAERERTIFEATVANAEETYTLIRDRFSSLGLQTWLSQHLSRLHREAYRLAVEALGQARWAYAFEIGEPATLSTTPSWHADRAGLLSGEHLLLELQHLQMEHQANHRRELELTKHVSLARIDPMALIRLRQTGQCTISVPEVLFDLDYPGHFFRRIKSVRLTLPCVTGPHTTIAATLRLTESRLRHEANVDPRVPDIEGFDGVSAVATSHAQDDPGVFELSFRDERYLPFEGAGAVSTWELTLPMGTPTDGLDLRAFDYETISDVVLRIDYTARSSTDATFAEGVLARIRSQVDAWLGSGTPLTRVISLRREFPSAWHALTHPTEGGEANVALRLGPEHFPRLGTRNDLRLAGESAVLVQTTTHAAVGEAVRLSRDGAGGASPLAPHAELSGMFEAQLPITGSPFGGWEIGLPAALVESPIEDVLVVLPYVLA